MTAKKTYVSDFMNYLFQQEYGRLGEQHQKNRLANHWYQAAVADHPELADLVAKQIRLDENYNLAMEMPFFYTAETWRGKDNIPIDVQAILDTIDEKRAEIKGVYQQVDAKFAAFEKEVYATPEAADYGRYMEEAKQKNFDSFSKERPPIDTAKPGPYASKIKSHADVPKQEPAPVPVPEAKELSKFGKLMAGYDGFVGKQHKALQYGIGGAEILGGGFFLWDGGKRFYKVISPQKDNSTESADISQQESEGFVKRLLKASIAAAETLAGAGLVAMGVHTLRLAIRGISASRGVGIGGA